MNKILSFFAGVCLVVLTAASTGVTEFKPATPKSTVVITADSPSYITPKILLYVKQNYIVKSVATSNYGTIAIMEKY